MIDRVTMSTDVICFCFVAFIFSLTFVNINKFIVHLPASGVLDEVDHRNSVSPAFPPAEGGRGVLDEVDGRNYWRTPPPFPRGVYSQSTHDQTYTVTLDFMNW